MRYFIWILRLAVFVVVLLFALKNTDRVTVRFFVDTITTDIPLIVVMLASFVAGTLFGLLLTVPASLRRRREAAALRRDLERAKAEAAAAAPVAAPVTTPPSPDVVLPMHPL
jgi:uncharacterized integral membrane protein